MPEKSPHNPEKGTPAWRVAVLATVPVNTGNPTTNIFHSSDKSIVIVKNTSNTKVTISAKRSESIIFYIGNDGVVTGATHSKGLELGRDYAPHEIAGITHWLDKALEKYAAEIKKTYLPAKSKEIAKHSAEIAKKALKQVPPAKNPDDDISSSLGGMVVDK